MIVNSLDTMQWQPFEKEKLRQQYGITTSKMVLAFVAADIRVPQKGMKLLGEVLKTSGSREISAVDSRKLWRRAGKSGESI